MGMFAETSNVDYHLSFADQGRQTFVFHFPFPFSICSKQKEIAIFR
jgi:hypothetical protein